MFGITRFKLTQAQSERHIRSQILLQIVQFGFEVREGHRAPLPFKLEQMLQGIVNVSSRLLVAGNTRLLSLKLVKRALPLALHLLHCQ